MLLLLLYATSVTYVVMGAELFDACTSDSSCGVKYGTCETISPSCNARTCVCIPGFTEYSSSECRIKKELGESCSNADKCVGENVLCNGGKCTCDTGYQTGPLNDCISTLKTLKRGERCYDSVQCFYKMVCLENKCQCYPGFVAEGDYDCREREVKDSCTADDDCIKANNTRCSDGKCVCQSGYKQVSFLRKGKGAYACIPSGESQRSQGQKCSYTVGTSNTMVCQKPLNCQRCHGDEMRCTAPWAKAITGASLRNTIALSLLAYVIVVAATSL